MTREERDALLLAARVLEAGVPVDGPVAVGEAGGHVPVGLTLAERLQRVAGCPQMAGEIVASLRSAAERAGTTTA